MNDTDIQDREPDIENPGSFASRLFLARNALSLTQEQVAERAGLQQSTIAHYEAGRREPSLANVRRLIWALDCGADYLMATRSGPDDCYREGVRVPAQPDATRQADDKYATQQRFDGQRASVGRVVVVAQPLCDDNGRITEQTEIVGGSIAAIRHDLPVINTEKGDVYEPGKDANGATLPGLEFMPCATERDIETMPAGSWTWPVRV